MKIMRAALLALGLVIMTGAFARSDVRDGNAMVKPVAADKYSIDGAIMGKAELFGYISDLKDREQLTGVVLRSGGNADQRQVIGSIAKTLQLKAFEQDGRDLAPIDLPADAPTPAPPPIENPADAAGSSADSGDSAS